MTFFLQECLEGKATAKDIRLLVSMSVDIVSDTVYIMDWTTLSLLSPLDNKHHRHHH